MFTKNKGDSPNTPKNYHTFELFLNATEFTKFDFHLEGESNLYILEEKDIRELTTFISLRVEILKLIEKLAAEKKVTKQRKKSLEETQAVVSSLQEIDHTSSNAMNFLKEKMDILLEERENLILNILNLKEEVEKSQDDESLKETILNFIDNITFIETESWEADLDYYRTRFLMQREQKEDESLKEQFQIRSVENDPERQNQYSLPPMEKMEIIKIAIHKKHHKDLEKTLLEHIQLQKIIELKDTWLLIQSTETIESLIREQERISFETGKKLYNLKREQGILSLKTYEIIQTMKSRLLNISGSIAGRKFLKDAFNEILELLNSKVSFRERKMHCLITVQRILRMLRNEPAG